ncbi:hypothetical protein Q5752_001835 [Cryptotrichosporon argae]
MTSEPAAAIPAKPASLSTVNAQLLAHGFARKALNLAALSERDEADVTAVLYELLSSSLSNLSTLDTLSARHRTLSYEHERLSKSLSASRKAESRLHAEVGMCRARVADLEKRLAREEDKARALREEVGRGRRAVETVRVAAGHEAKKAQAKLDKALAQLSRAEPSRPPLAHGLVVLNPVVGNRLAPVATGQAPLLEQSLKELAEIRAGLQEETDAFRHVIVSTANGLRDALALSRSQEPPPRLSHFQFFSPTLPAPGARPTGTLRAASSTSHPALADSHLRALLTDVHARLTADAPPPPSVLALAPADAEDEEARAERQRAERERERHVEDLVSRVKDLEVEVRCGAAREEEAKKALEELARSQVQPAPSIVTDDMIDLRAEIARQKRALEEERRQMTESTIRLVEDRRRLEAERRAFLDEQRQADADRLRAYLPSSPSLSPSASSTDTQSASASPTTDASPSSTAAAPPRSPRPTGPHGPSPLSPHRRTPKRRPKTPLSRLVLEKAVRERAKAGVGSSAGVGTGGSVSASTSASALGTALHGPAPALALGDGARRTNTHALPVPVTVRASKDAAASALGSSVGVGVKQKALGASVSKSEVGAAAGVGPRTASKARVWR